MRKIIVIILVGLFLAAPTAIVTARQNWGEISITLGKISETLGNISTLISQGVVIEQDELSLTELIEKSEIPLEIISAAGSLMSMKSAEFDSETEINTTISTNRTSSDASATIGFGGSFDSRKEAHSLDISLSANTDRDFTEIMFGDYYQDLDAATSFNLALSTVFTNGNFYLNILEGGDLGIVDFSGHRNQWIVFEDETGDSFGVGGRVDEVGDIFTNEVRRDKETRDFLKAYIKHPIFEFTRLTDPMIDGQWYTAYRIDIVKKNLIAFNEAKNEISGSGYNPLSIEERREAERVLKDLDANMTLVFNSARSEVRRLTTNIVVDSEMVDADAAQMVNPDVERFKVSVASVVNLTKLNDNINFDTPRNAIPFEDIIEDIFALAGDSMLREEDENWYS